DGRRIDEPDPLVLHLGAAARLRGPAVPAPRPPAVRGREPRPRGLCAAAPADDGGELAGLPGAGPDGQSGARARGTGRVLPADRRAGGPGLGAALGRRPALPRPVVGVPDAAAAAPRPAGRQPAGGVRRAGAAAGRPAPGPPD